MRSVPARLLFPSGRRSGASVETAPRRGLPVVPAAFAAGAELETFEAGRDLTKWALYDWQQFRPLAQ